MVAHRIPHVVSLTSGSSVTVCTALVLSIMKVYTLAATLMLLTATTLMMELLIEKAEWIGMMSTTTSLILENLFTAIVLAPQLVIRQDFVRFTCLHVYTWGLPEKGKHAC